MIPIVLADAPEAPPTRDVYLPLILTPPVDQAAEFLRLLTTDARQQRTRLVKSDALQQAAIWRAHGLANGEPWSHVDSHGVGPNSYARRAGCNLPPDYSQNGNQIESLVAGSGDAAVMFASLAVSPKHAEHIFGRGWFQRQCCAGIAMAENPAAEYRWYWVIMLAECGQSSGE